MKRIQEEVDGGVRITKELMKIGLHCGISSNAQAMEVIGARRVRINNTWIEDENHFVQPEDDIYIDSKILNRNISHTPEVVIFHKPSKVLTTRFDPDGRQNIYDLLPKKLQKLVYIGRLDFMSEGLLLLTNSGLFSEWMSAPKSGIKRVYKVRVFVPLYVDFNDGLFDDARSGNMRVEGMRYSPMEIFIMKGSKRSTKNNRRIAEGEPKNKWLKITLKEGKKNEIRNVMKALGLTVSKLVRVSYGPFKLCSLPVGRTRPAFDYELEAIIKNFKKQNNKTLN